MTQMKKFIQWIGGLFTNPTTGDISHTKLWANVAALVMTVKFARMDTPELDLWWAYGAMVGGYALIRRGIAAAQQFGQTTDKATGGKDAE